MIRTPDFEYTASIKMKKNNLEPTLLDIRTKLIKPLLAINYLHNGKS